MGKEEKHDATKLYMEASANLRKAAALLDALPLTSLAFKMGIAIADGNWCHMSQEVFTGCRQFKKRLTVSNELTTEQETLATITKLEERKAILLSPLSQEEQQELATICNTIEVLKVYLTTP